ncbi:uracil-DNA glycosylase family protein [Marinirhabdus gelatinilytica]|uniref:G/U mismatch-specific uracil-DNA glycosylase n=1 Tax=Marinirhabdus gelatinilytica TaxID=1703343 RepID=A0A370Q3M6_9FLAO|nr:uracil-DNA glycosylase family protein [Marinirhabdus gelatinilytica]RDK82961.1 G/U mismatch-specific uracil-DNA glycosylase [Marinirhabdus gelatinilytica]
MFLHTHPYPPFIPAQASKLIVGTLPPPRFTTGELKDGDVNFCYGSRDGQLWPILDRLFKLNLPFETTTTAIEHRKNFLQERGIGICDIVAIAKREKIDASDLGMQEVVLRDIISILEQYPNIETLLFMGGNSKNGPEYFFRRILRDKNIDFAVVDPVVPRIHSFVLPESKRKIKTVTLTAPSGAANRAVGALPAYKEMKQKNPKLNTIDFRILQYKPHF